MTFFSRLFAKKAGGTRVGNLISAIAYENTYGLLGRQYGKGRNGASGDGTGW